jgi:hypothetical protein
MVFGADIFINPVLENKKSGWAHFSSKLSNLKSNAEEYSTASYSEQYDSKNF